MKKLRSNFYLLSRESKPGRPDLLDSRLTGPAFPVAKQTDSCTDEYRRLWLYKKGGINLTLTVSQGAGTVDFFFSRYWAGYRDSGQVPEVF